MCGASGWHAARVADAVTLRPFTRVAPVASVTLRLGLVVLTALTSAADRELFWAVTVQVDRPLMSLIELGSQLCARLTMPCRLKNATGRCRSRDPPSWSRSIRPKYWPWATAGAEMVMLRVTCWPGGSANAAGLTEIEVPAGDWVLVL